MDIKLINNNMIKFLDLQKVTSKYADEIHNAVNRVVDSGWYLQGKENEKFEENYSHYIGVKHTIGCANGLDALIWILRAYVERGVMKPGDEVIVPANTYIASISREAKYYKKTKSEIVGSFLYIFYFFFHKTKYCYFSIFSFKAVLKASSA